MSSGLSIDKGETIENLSDHVNIDCFMLGVLKCQRLGERLMPYGSIYLELSITVFLGPDLNPSGVFCF